eukprot:CFRG3226T1
MGSLLDLLPSFKSNNFSDYTKGQSRAKRSAPKSYVPTNDTAPPEHQVIKSDTTNILLRALAKQFSLTKLETEDDPRKRNLTNAHIDEGESSSGNKHLRTE